MKWGSVGSFGAAGRHLLYGLGMVLAILTSSCVGEDEIYDLKGDADLGTGDFLDAILEYNKAIELDPTYYHYYVSRSVAEEARGDFDAAIADDDKALELYPDYEDGYIARANTKRLKGEFDAAIADDSKAIELNGVYIAFAYHDRAEAKLAKGDFVGAGADQQMYGNEMNSDYNTFLNKLFHFIGSH